ncbi:hypothetical protein SLEP1_g11451 [Rubroshorea leprosula]|uniref:Integrase catalytic domain-containing protein n=1 Tax=Rubroshorea leprosula TaxID=152421 RepID=A0AAV5IKK1_9ROSI|nr:hypothetical protein SLEP1_g11451 [Rubroshorea leprosula]
MPSLFPITTVNPVSSSSPRNENFHPIGLFILDSRTLSEGTLPQQSCPYTSEQNGRAERKHRHILDSIRALLISSSCPERFWGEAALTAVYLINRIPSSVLNNQSPYERLHGILPAYNLLKVFGCACFVLLPPHEHNKLELRARLCYFLGYGITQKGYRCWDPVSQKLRVSRHVVFWEHTMFSSLSNFKVSSSHQPPFFTNPSIKLFPSDSNAGTSDELYNASPHAPTSFVEDDLPVGNASDNFEPSSTSSSTNELVVPSSSHPTRVRKPPNYLRDYHCFPAVTSLHEPQSYQEASSNPLWQQAMQDELQALENTRTWDLVDLPTEKSLIGCKWVYKIKTRSDGSVERYKAHLVAKGFTQEYGIDYEETFAPVARLTSVRSLLAIAAIWRWKLFQMDVKNAFLNGDLEEEVYMKPPPGLHHPPNKVCRLRRALYGLKQSPRAWYAKFSATVSEFGFTSSPHDTALFIPVLRIIRYVKGTLFHGLHFSANSSLVLRAYSDADWAGDPSDRRSTTGYCLFLGNSLISWRSKKQAIPSRSSTEAEYRALGDTTSELLSLRWLLEDMGIPQPSSTDLYCDN